MKKRSLTLAVLSSVVLGGLAGCNSGNSSNGSAQGIQLQSAQQDKVQVTAARNLIKAAYVDMSAATAYDAIPNTGFASANVIVFGFADVTTRVMPDAQSKQIQKVMRSETSGTVNFLSLGGEYAKPETFNANTVSQIASNIIAQINDFNSKNTVKIDGVDLDLEQGIDGNTVASLANLFKQQGLKVAAAPQVYLNSGNNIDSANPSNMVLTSGGGGTPSDLSRQNVYQSALSARSIDYLFVQGYNTRGFTVDQADEGNVHFFKNAAKALNSVVKTQCSGSSLCIPSSTKIVMGAVANKYAGWYTPFSNNTTVAEQQTVLNQLKADIDSMVDNSVYSNFAGTMVWSLNMDYAANLYNAGNTAYGKGAFTSTIFGAAPAPSTPYFILQVTNNAHDAPNKYVFGSVSLIVNGSYYVFGNQWDQPITPQIYQLWGTAPSSQNPATPGVSYSPTLDSLFSDGTSSFTASIQVNGYQDNGTGAKVTGSFKCRTNPTYTFEAGNTYNIIFNATDNSNGTAACEVKKL